MVSFIVTGQASLSAYVILHPLEHFWQFCNDIPDYLPKACWKLLAPLHQTHFKYHCFVVSSLSSQLCLLFSGMIH